MSSNPLLPVEVAIAYGASARRAASVPSACVPEGAILTTAVTGGLAGLRLLQFSAVKDLTCLLVRTVSLCFGQRDGEPRWSFCLRVRFALHGDWHRLHEHRAGRRPYLQSLGKLVRERRAPPVLRFEPEGGALPTRVPFGAVCELAPPAC